MHRYEVGQIYHPGKTHWQPGSDFNYRSGVLELRLMFDKLTQSDIRAIRNGPCSFHLAVVNDILWFLFEFGRACPLSDNSYSWWLVPEQERTTPPELDPGEMAVLTIILISAEDGIIRAMRRISLGHDFSQALYGVIREQTHRPFNQAKHDQAIARTYRTYPTTQALLKQAKSTCIVEASVN